MLSRVRKRLAERKSGGGRHGSLARSESGLALIEFAVSLPVLLTLGLVGLETAHFVLAHLRINNIASMSADGAARVRDSIDEADVAELFVGSNLTGRAIEFEENGRIILSSVERSTDGTKQWIRWQRCTGQWKQPPSYGTPIDANGNPITNGTENYKTDGTPSSNPSSDKKATMTAIGPVGNQIEAQAGTAVMVAEVVYRYQPLVPNALLANRPIRYLAAFNVRQRTNQLISNGGKKIPLSCG